MSCVSTQITTQDQEQYNQINEANQQPYQNEYGVAIIGQFTHPRKSNSNSFQQIKLIAKGSDPKEDQMDKLEQILIQLKIPYKNKNEIITLNIVHYEQWDDQIQEQFFKPHENKGQINQTLHSDDTFEPYLI